MVEILQGTLDRAVLNKLFELARRTDNQLDAHQIAGLFDFEVSAKRVEMSLGQLENDGSISGVYSTLAEATYSIDRKGYLAVEQGRQLDDSFDRLYAEFGDSWLEETGGSDTSESAAIGGASEYGTSEFGDGPSQDRNIETVETARPTISAIQSSGQASVIRAIEGEPVPASDRAVSTRHNSSEYEELVKSIQKAEKVIRETNAWEGEEREEIRDYLQAGLEVLKKPKVYLSLITVLLLQPLHAAYNAAMEEEARIVIDAAIAALKAFFGI